MAPTYIDLKAQHRNEREMQPKQLALRIHRALSWLNRAEQCNDDDGRFIFLWIAFNAAYANETGNQRIREGTQYSEFLKRIIQLDTDELLSPIIWQQYSNAIRVILDNPYVFQPYWNHQNNIPGYADWQTSFNKAKQAAHASLMNKDTATTLSIIFSRLYTLRNQLIHGGATWNSKVNRAQLRDANRILGDIIPRITQIMMNNSDQDWGEACYPVIN